MNEKLEITLRVTLDRAGIREQLKKKVESDTAFFILGMVHALLTSKYGVEHCQVEMASATGLDQGFLQTMNSFARRHKEAVDALEAHGEVWVDDQALLEVLQLLHDVVVTPVNGGWQVSHHEAAGECTRRMVN